MTTAQRVLRSFVSKMVASTNAATKPKLHGYDFYRSIGSPKLVIAPMVDQSELAWRLMSRQPIPPPHYRHREPSTALGLSERAYAFYRSLDDHPDLKNQTSSTPLGGADLCYTPMIHAQTFAESSQHSKQKYVSEVFNFSEGEEGSGERIASLDVSDRSLFVQFCANDPEVLLRAAKAVEDRCDAVDINFGCPQNIAKRGRYGSFLQDEWDLIFKLINVLHVNLSIPVTAKFRVFPDVERTVEYAKMMERAGASILTCHGRTREMKGQLSGLADWQKIKAVKEAVKVPVFANGNILYREDVDECLRVTGCDGVMTAEGNLSNPALFVPATSNLSHYPIDVMATYYLDIVSRIKTFTAGSAIKAHLFRILRPAVDRHTDLRNKLGAMNGNVEQFRPIVAEVSQRIAAEMDAQPLETLPLPRDAKGIKTIPHWASQPYVRAAPPSMPVVANAETIGGAMADAVNGTTGEDRVVEANNDVVLCSVEGCRNISAGLCPRVACLLHCRAQGAFEAKKADTLDAAMKLTLGGLTVGSGCQPHEEKDQARKDRKAEMRANKSKMRQQRKRGRGELAAEGGGHEPDAKRARTVTA